MLLDFRDFKDFGACAVCVKTLASRVAVGVTGHTVAQNTGLAYPKNSSETDFRFTFFEIFKNSHEKVGRKIAQTLEFYRF